MEAFFAAIEQAIAGRNWYAALVLSLIMPDICGKAMYGGGVGERYKKWFDAYLAHNYAHPIGAERELHVFMTGEDLYLLRCALLHAGSDVIRSDVDDALTRFVFVEPPSSGLIHLNQSDTVLQLQVDLFAREMLAGCRTWWTALTTADKAKAEQSLIEVRRLEGGFSF
jgi:hypothetical protein